MKTEFVKKCAVIVSAAAILPLFAAVSTRTAEMAPQGSGMTLKNKLAGRDWKNAVINMTLFDGKSGKYCAEKAVVTDLQDKIKVEFKGADYTYTTTFTARGDLIYGEAAFVNNSKVEKWIEPGITAKIAFTKNPTVFWDGFGKTRNIGTKALKREGIKGTVLEHIGSKELPFTAGAAFTGKGGMHLGHGIFEPVSYSAVYYVPDKKELTFTQRHAVHPGETLKFTWIIGSVNAEFGGPEAVIQQHYDAFPERWAVDQENPYIWGNSAHYLNWKHKPIPEETRRLKMTNDWAYCAYKRAGDIACRPELWDYKLRNPIVIPNWARFGGQKVPMYKISREDFLALRKQEFRKYGKRYGQMFYANCSGTWCEIDLAKKLYPDAVNNLDPDANHILKKWSTWHDWEIRVFSMGTSFAEAFKRDMVQLTEELDLPGFAFDCATGGVSYYGPATKKHLPGRAWDKRGVFIDQFVAVNHMVEFIHSIRPGMVAFCNGQVKGDLLMFERDFARTDEVSKMMPLYMWYIGPRPVTVWGGANVVDMLADWRNFTPEELQEMFSKLGTFYVFNQFKYGMTAIDYNWNGLGDLQYIFPELFELRRAGWRANIPVKLGKTVYAPYKGAYGKAENTFFFFGNSSAKPTTGGAAVDNELLTAVPNERMVFVKKMRRTATLANRFRGKCTNFRAILPSRVPVLYETACAITGAPEKVDLLASSKKDFDKQVFTVKILKSADFTGSIKIRAIRGFDSVLKLNGQEIAPGSSQQLKSGDVITAEYTSKVIAVKKADIMKFACGIHPKNVKVKVFAAADDKNALAAAAQLQDFFKYLKSKKVINRYQLDLVSDPAQRGNAGVIALDSRAKAAKITVSANGGINIAAANAAELEKTVEQFLDLMDLRFPYTFPFKPNKGIPKELLSHAKLLNKALPARKFFD